MKRFFPILTLFILLACEKVDTSSSAYVITGNPAVSGNVVTLKATLASSVDPASVSSAYFLVSEDAKIPEKKARKVETSLSGDTFSETISDLEYAKTYYCRAVVVIDRKTRPGKIRLFNTDPLRVSRVQFLNHNLNLMVGDKVKLEYKILPEGATNQNVEFYVSSGYGCASVEQDTGIVTALLAGESKVTVKTEDGNYTDVCTLSIRSVCPPEAVDLGLSVYWAKRNINAQGWVESESDKGTYFAYPNTAYPQRLNLPGSSAIGSGWHVPSRDEVRELLNNCTVKSTSLNGVQGVRVTGKNGNSIFLPEAVYYTSTDDGTREHTDPSNYGLGGYHMNYYTFEACSSGIIWGEKCGRYASYVRLVLL